MKLHVSRNAALGVPSFRCLADMLLKQTVVDNWVSKKKIQPFGGLLIIVDLSSSKMFKLSPCFGVCK